MYKNRSFFASLLYFGFCEMSKTGHFTPIFKIFPALQYMFFLKPFLLRTNLSCIFWPKYHTRCFSCVFDTEVVPKNGPFSYHSALLQPLQNIQKRPFSLLFKNFSLLQNNVSFKSVFSYLQQIYNAFLVHKCTLDHHTRCFPIF